MRGTHFMKQSDISTEPNRCFDTGLSTAFTDMFAGRLTTADIRDLPYKEGLFLEIPTSETPNYGSGEVVGHQLGLYINSIAGNDIPTLGIWKAKQGITDNVGSFGTTVVKDIYSMTSFVSDVSTSKIWQTNFEGGSKGTFYSASGYSTRTVSSGPYVTCQNAWDEWATKSLSQHDFQSFKEKYGTKHEVKGADAEPVIYLEKKTDPIEGDFSDAVGTFFHNIQNDKNAMAGVGEAYAEYTWYVKGQVGTPWDGTNDPSWDVQDSDLDVKYDYEVTNRITNNDKSVRQFMDTNGITGIDHTICNNQFRAILENANDVNTLWSSGFFFEEGDTYSGARAIRADLKANHHIKAVTHEIPESDEEFNGFMQVASFFKDDIVPGIVMTKDPEQDSSGANSTAASNKVRQKVVVNTKINKLTEVVAKDNSGDGASFPSRGMAMWFKNRYATSDVSEWKHWNVAKDIYTHHYNANKSNFESATTGLAGSNNSPFCGFIMYKYKYNYYIKSLGSAEGSAGFNFGEAEGDETSTVPMHFNFDPDSTTWSAGCVKLHANPIGKWVQFQMVFNPRGSGFVLYVVDSETGSLLCQPVQCWSSQASSSCNATTSWPYFSAAAYNCASLGTTSDSDDYAGETNNVNFRPSFTCLSTPATDSEETQKDNSPTHTDVIFDSAFVTNGGFNYKHINSTLAGNTSVQPGKIGIAHRTAIDSSVVSQTIDDNNKTIEDTTGFTPATFLSFGFKTTADAVPLADGVPKYLYFNDFQPRASIGEAQTGIDSRYMKWAWSTASPKLGLQLWGIDNDGSVTDDGTVGASMFTHGGGSGNMRMYFSSSQIDSEGNAAITPLLSNEFFSQKGHIAYASTDISDGASMNSTIVKRENVFCSMRILHRMPQSRYQCRVDTFNPLRSQNLDDDEEYIAYIHSARYAPVNYITGLKVKNITHDADRGGAGYIEWNKNLTKSDAYRTLQNSALDSASADVLSTASNDTLTWNNSTQVELKNGTRIKLLDYFRAGDQIQIAVSGTAAHCEGTHTIESVTATTIVLETNLTSDDTISAGTLSIHKVGDDFILQNPATYATDTRFDDSKRMFISPHRYWIFAEIFNYDYDSTFSEGIKLPDKTYTSVVATDLKPAGSSESGSTDFGADDFGATWNEWLCTDGYPNQKPWNLTRDATANQVLIVDHDFGHGAYIKDDGSGTVVNAGTGGYVQKHIPELTIEGNPQTNLIDITSIRSHKEYAPSESIYLWMNMVNSGSDAHVNVSTFDNTDSTQRPFLLTTYFDERPNAPVLSVQPYEKDTFLPEYTWDTDADDLWYGLLHIDHKNIASQYHNANWRLHLNEDLKGYEKSSYNKIIKMTQGTAAGADILYDYFSTTATAVRFNGDRISSISGNVVVDATAKTITIAGYGDLTDTFSSGQSIDIVGMSNSGNNLTNVAISSLSSTVIGVSSATTLVNETRGGGFVTVGNVSTKKLSLTSPGVDLNTVFNAGDKICVHHATDNSLVTGFGVEYTVASAAAAHVIVEETMTTNATHTSALTVKNQATPPDDRYDGLSGHTKHFSGTNKNVLTFTGHNSSNEGKFSLCCHVVNDDVTLSGTDYIIYSRATDLSGSVDYNYYVAVNASGNIVVSVQGNSGSDNNAATTLTSASIIPTDGETPMHIAFTLDKDLPAQNLKLFINGVMEASSGVAADAGSTNTTSVWARDLNMSGNSSNLFIGAEDQSGNNGFNGKIEEVVAYGETIYPVNPRDGKFLHTKPLEDFQGTSTTVSPTSYTARLFIKDYHNIRGSSATEIATSSLISFRKPVFDLRGG